MDREWRKNEWMTGWTTGKHMPLPSVVGGRLNNLTFNNWLISVLYI